jgi:hypothetical protein
MKLQIEIAPAVNGLVHVCISRGTDAIYAAEIAQELASVVVHEAVRASVELLLRSVISPLEKNQ